MDPFTQKLLARTQARKNQLVKKREELEACRAKRNSPIHDRTRRPLSEDNTESGSADVDTDDIKRRRIGSEDSGKSAILNNSKDIDANSPSVQARKERLMKMQQKDQENGATPKKHWKAVTRGAGVNNSNVSSPSVASRSAAFQANAARDQQKENIKDKKHLELQGSHTPGKLAEARSVFENSVSTKSKVNDEKDKFVPPPKPPRVAVTEDNSEKSSEEQLQAAKRKAPSPPKNTKENKSGNHNSNSVIKRKALEPPTTCHDESQFKNDNRCDMKKISKGAGEIKDAKARNSQRSSSTDEEGNGNFPPVPVKRDRRGSVDDLDDVNKADGDQPTPKPRTKVISLNEADNKTQKECGDNKKVEENKTKATSDNRVTIVATPVGSEERLELNHGKQWSEEQPCVIQACAIEEENPKVVAKSGSSRSIVTVQAVSHDNPEEKRNANRRDETQVTAVKESKTEKPPSAAKLADQDSKQEVASVVWEKQAKSSSKKQRKSIKKEEFAFKVPRRPTKESHFDPNETINLNDVNIHEMTFTFDFGQFDELEKERESIFKMGYEEKCKQLEKEQEKKRKESASASSMGADREERGTYQSGYNSQSSEQYATKTVHKPKQPVPQRPKRVQDEIKVLLEEAAYQQNIVLQASQALNLCVANDITFKGSQEEIEAEKVLLLATEHRTACLDEVNKLKTGDGVGDEDAQEFKAMNSSGSEMPACTATLSLSGIKITLRQELMDMLRVGIRSGDSTNEGSSQDLTSLPDLTFAFVEKYAQDKSGCQSTAKAYKFFAEPGYLHDIKDLGVFYFVCIIQHGTHDFYCSRVLSTNDATEGNFLVFPEKFTLKDLKPDFTVAVKLFCMNVKKTMMPAPVSTPTKHKIFQSPKVVKGMLAGRRTSDTPSPATQVVASPQTVFRTSSFVPVGVTHINLPIMKSKQFSLDKVPDTCPLTNFLEMKVDCSPQYSNRVNGFLTILEDIGGYGAWQRRWCVLQGAVMSYWRYPGDEETKSPMGCINLADCINEEVTRVARDLCARPNTMELKLRRSCGTEVKYLLAADTKSDRATWIDSLNEALRDGRAWTGKDNEVLYPDLSYLHNQDVYMCSKATV